MSIPLRVAQAAFFALITSQAVWQVWAKLGPAAGILYGTGMVVAGGIFLAFSFTGYLKGRDALALVGVGVFCAGFLSAILFGRTSQSLATSLAWSAMETLVVRDLLACARPDSEPNKDEGRAPRRVRRLVTRGWFAKSGGAITEPAVWRRTCPWIVSLVLGEARTRPGQLNALPATREGRGDDGILVDAVHATIVNQVEHDAAVTTAGSRPFIRGASHGEAVRRWRGSGKDVEVDE